MADKHILKLIYGELRIQGNTVFTEQDKIVNMVNSKLVIENVEVQDVRVEQDMVSLAYGEAVIDGLVVKRVEGEESSKIFQVETSTISLSHISYTSSNLTLISSTFSTISISSIFFTNLSMSSSLFNFRSSIIESFKNSSLMNIETLTSPISFINWHIGYISNISLTNIGIIPVVIRKSTGESIQRLDINNCSTGIFIQQSEFIEISNSHFQEWGSLDKMHSGAIYLDRSNITVRTSTFERNYASEGAAISINWRVQSQCKNEISENIFKNNQALKKGGAIYYNLNRPSFDNNTFIKNSAQYGENIASYPVKVYFYETGTNKMTLYNIESGIQSKNDIQVRLVDFDGQTMILEDSKVVKITSSLINSTITGVNYAKFKNGVAIFKNITFVSSPGDKNIEYSVTTKAIGSEIIDYIYSETDEQKENFKNKILTNFRYCKPGERIDDLTWVKWSQGTFTLNWNSTSWEPCMEKASWTGTTVISVDDGYWRKDLNSTKIVECLRKESCLGGYEPNNENPINCKTGYEGYLCSRWQIVNEDKYQPSTNYQCLKWPSKVMNAFRVIGVQLLSLSFLSILIIINIRKRKENQFSILLRIFTNYTQLLSSIMTFNLDFPHNFNEIFSQSNRITSPQETFSFDCFVEDYEIRLFAPTNSLFKVSLFILLPIFLLTLIFIGIMLLKIILYVLNKTDKVDIFRYLVISFISIIFVFHPSMVEQSLAVFQCAQVDENDYRMVMNMDFKWYSLNHLKWILLTAIPVLIFWVVGMPFLAFIILFKNKHNLESETMRKYFLLLFQGFREEIFYWEIFKTIIKFILLSLNAFLSTFFPYYRILTGISKDYYS